MAQVHVVRCNQVVAQVSLGYYDAEGNLVGEAIFPQGETGPSVARLFHPHGEQLVSRVEWCVQQAWEALRANGQAGEPPGREERPMSDKAEMATGR